MITAFQPFNSLFQPFSLFSRNSLLAFTTLISTVLSALFYQHCAISTVLSALCYQHRAISTVLLGLWYCQHCAISTMLLELRYKDGYKHRAKRVLLKRRVPQIVIYCELRNLVLYFWSQICVCFSLRFFHLCKKMGWVGSSEPGERRIGDSL